MTPGEVHDGRGEETIGVEELSRVPVSSDDAPGRQRYRSRGRAPLEQFVVVQEEVDAKTK